MAYVERLNCLGKIQEIAEKGTARSSAEEYVQVAALFHINGHWLASLLNCTRLIYSGKHVFS